MTRRLSLAAAIDAVEEQRRWIADHGGNLEGYIKRYGAHDDPNKYGDGGAPIFAADYAELQRRERAMERRSYRLSRR